MKWFKHQSNARNDERLARLEDKAGLEGYGFYFKMLEIVASAIDEKNKSDLTLSVRTWARFSNVSTRKFETLLKHCVDVGLMFEQTLTNVSPNFNQTLDKLINVNIPNLLKYRDNHTKNLQGANKQEEEEELEREKEESLRKKIPATPSDVNVLIELGVDETAAKDWLKVRKAKRAPLTKTVIAELRRESCKAGITIADAVLICAKKSWQGFNASWKWQDALPEREEVKKPFDMQEFLKAHT